MVVAFDEYKPETLADLISLLGQALRDPDLPVDRILLTSGSGVHICRRGDTPAGIRDNGGSALLSPSH